jgi:serine/threonine protein kinase
MSAIASSQNLGIFSDAHPQILESLTRVPYQKRESIGKFILLNLDGDPKFPHKGHYKAIFYCVSKVSRASQWIIFVASRMSSTHWTKSREQKSYQLLKDVNGVQQPLLFQRKGDFDWMVTDLFNQGSLHRVLKHVSLEKWEREYIGLCLVNVIFDCHLRGVIHRDIKPDNVLVHRRLDGTLSIKLIDFELAFFKDGNDSSANKFCGTMCSTPPEIWDAISKPGREISVDYERDAWALGCSLFRIIAREDYGLRILYDNKNHPINVLWNSLWKCPLGTFSSPIRDLLTKDPKYRLKLSDAKQSMTSLFQKAYPNQLVSDRSDPARVWDRLTELSLTRTSQGDSLWGRIRSFLFIVD